MLVKKHIASRGFLVERLVAEMYVEVFGISDLDNDENPYALVACSPIDGLYELGPIYSRIRDFRLYGVNERYSINLVDFLNLPHHIAQRLIEVSKLDIAKISKIQSKNVNKVENDLAREGFKFK